MNLLCVSSRDKYEGELMGYNAVGNKLVYLTDREISVVKLGGKFGKESTSVKGEQVVNFVVSKRGFIALLYRNKTVQVRRMDRLSEVTHRFSNILLLVEEGYPKMKWDYDQLYLLYADSIEILSMKDRTRRGYTDIVADYPGECIMDMVISNVMEAERAVLLQLRNHLLLTIIPIPVTELAIPNINQTLTLCSLSPQMDSRREYVVVLCGNSQLRIYNMVSLKQIAEVELLLNPGEFAEMQADANCECVMVRFVSESSLDITRNFIYKVNSHAYFAETKDYFSEGQPFFLYRIEVTIQQNLTLFPVSEQQLDNEVFDSYHFSFFKQRQLYLAQQLIPRGYTQNLKEMSCKMGCFEWQEVLEWKDIICSYLQIATQAFTHQQKMAGFSKQERQMYEYNILKDDFDAIVSRFMEKITEERQGRPISQHDMEKEWGKYLAKVAQERHFILQTMELFKLESQALFDKQQESAEISLELQQCMKDMQGREGRIDAKIMERKKELEEDRKKEENKRKDKQQEQKKEVKSQENKGKPKLTQQEIRKYEQEYQQFVAQFLAENARKQQQEANKKIEPKSILTLDAHIQTQKINLVLPVLNEAEKKRIHGQLFNNQDIGQEENQANQANHPFQEDTSKATEQLQTMLNTVEQCLSPLTHKLQTFIDRLTTLQKDQHRQIQRSEDLIKGQTSIDLQYVVKSNCRKMFSVLSTQIRQGIDSTAHKINQLQERNIRYYEQTIAHFKEYIKLQMHHRVDLFYRSRKQLQIKLSNMIKEQKQAENIASDCCMILLQINMMFFYNK